MTRTELYAAIRAECAALGYSPDVTSLALAFAQHEGVGKMLIFVNNPFGYKYLGEKDKRKGYGHVLLPGNKFDLAAGDSQVAYRTYPTLRAAIVSWAWQLFEAPSYAPIRDAHNLHGPLSTMAITPEAADALYRRWSANESERVMERIFMKWKGEQS